MSLAIKFIASIFVEVIKKHMLNNKMRLLIILTLFSLPSCYVHLRYTYNTSLEFPNYSDTVRANSNDSLLKEMVYEDSLFRFKFNPKPNGIWFEIQNLTTQNIYLLWDQSYFIEPYGNTSKLLNTDYLETKNVILEKQNNESIIPKRESFIRFTSSSKNVQEFEKIDFYSYQISPLIKSTKSYYEKSYLHKPYWITEVKRDCESNKDKISQVQIAINEITNVVKNNNNLGLGFTFRIGEDIVEYDFKIKVDVINIYVYDPNKTMDYEFYGTQEIR